MLECVQPSFLDECVCVLYCMCESERLPRSGGSDRPVDFKWEGCRTREHKRRLWHRRVLTQRVSVQTTPLPNEGCKCKSLSLSLMTRASFFIIMSFNLISLFIWQGLPRDPLQRFTLCSQLAQAGARVFFRVSFTENKKKRLCCISNLSLSLSYLPF